MLLNAILYCVIVACMLVIVGAILHGVNRGKQNDANAAVVRAAIREYQAEIAALRERGSEVAAERDRLAATVRFANDAWSEFRRASSSFDREHAQEAGRAITDARRRLDNLLGWQPTSQPESGVRAVGASRRVA